MIRRARAWAALVVAPTTLLSLLPAGAAGAAPVCDDVAVAPAFASDGTMFCVARELPRPDLGPTGVAFFRSTDRGRTWIRTTAAGLTWTQNSVWRHVVVSPNYARDRAVFVQDNTQGLFLTRDGGTTFTLVNPLVAFDDDQPSLGPATSPASIADLPGPLLYAGHGTFPMLIRPPVHTLVPSVPPTVTLRAFLTLAGTTPASRAYAVAENDNGSNLAAEHTIELYACDATYACAERVASFPKGMALREAHLTAGFNTRPGIVVSLYRSLGATGDLVQIWSSSDGRRFARARSVERLMGITSPADVGRTHAYVDTLDGTRQYALIDRRSRGATRSLYYSGDGGRTWSRRAHARFGGTAEMPSPSVYSPLYAHRLWLLPNGALAVTGTPANSFLGNAFACSVDGGRRWRTHC